MRNTLTNLSLALATLIVAALLMLLFGVQAATVLAIFLLLAIVSGTANILCFLMEIIDSIRGWMGWLR
jgi:preprotein translocase subunit SecF